LYDRAEIKFWEDSFKMKEMFSKQEREEIEEEALNLEKFINEMEISIDSEETQMKKIGLYIGKISGSFRYLSKQLGLFNN
jgi:transcription antitermination factor NusA-like protein